MYQQCLFKFTVFLSLISTATNANIGFFCNAGAYSHDAYASHLAESVISHGHNVSIIQISIFTFNRKVPFQNKFQRYISHDITNDQTAREAQERSQQLMWQVILPYDIYNGSLIGIRALLDIQKSYMLGCKAALENQTFMSNLRNLNLDMMVIDYAMNDCAIGLANYLNVPTAYISSVPFGSNYLDYIGIPSNPAYVPVLMCNYEPYEEDILHKLLNVFGYFVIGGFRRLWYNRAYNIFNEKLKIKLPNLDLLERRTMMFASPWEMFFDMPRPLARNLRYFGCESCDTNEIQSQDSNFTDATAGVVLVSFGTLVNAEDIPIKILQSFLKAFTKFPGQIFVWQLDVSDGYFRKYILNPLNMEMPKNIRLHRWIPMKQLLRDPKVLLVITHGGATTCLEAAYSGTPIFGIAIHSDQYHNTHRLAHRGLGEALQVVDITEENIKTTLHAMFGDHKTYKSRALKFRDMLLDYRNFEKMPSAFWIDFLARHFGGRASEVGSKLEKYWTLNHPGHWLLYHCCDIILAVLILFSLLAYII